MFQRSVAAQHEKLLQNLSARLVRRHGWVSKGSRMIRAESARIKWALLVEANWNAGLPPSEDKKLTV